VVAVVAVVLTEMPPAAAEVPGHLFQEHYQG
jgi:hypothetical protein